MDEETNVNLRMPIDCQIYLKENTNVMSSSDPLMSHFIGDAAIVSAPDPLVSHTVSNSTSSENKALTDMCEKNINGDLMLNPICYRRGKGKTCLLIRLMSEINDQVADNHYFCRTFVIRTDHNSLTWLLNFKNIEGQLARWIEELSQYNMIIQHRAGKKHINADGLSRIPDDIEACRNYRPDVNLEELPCGGCKFCTRARQQLQTFEEEVDFVVPLTIRRLVDDGSYNTNWTPSYSPVELH
ncbi:unnamed protein product [Mytilus edulis]|uniref:Reverse transcriptase RNase H-like domain-containing protein n=1 Tax=Mytilus edulis TaxID=6550 RepID=A0A8S3TQ60_MYTED|nr:unnamed protein product [Mytilus edulis]